jgi:hypothetical protein
MSDENLGAVLDESYLDYQKQSAIKNLGARSHLTIGQLAKLCEHPKHGQVVATITLQDLLDVHAPSTETGDGQADPAPKKTASSKKKTAKKKTSSKKKTAKKTSSSKKKTAKRAHAPKADKGKPKPRLDYDKGTREVLAALKAAKEPVARSAIEQATGFTGVQVRAFAKKLAENGKIKILGEGGRSTKYTVV